MITAEQFGYVSELVRRESAIVLPPGKEYLVESRLQPLARALGVTDVAAYIQQMMRAPDSRQKQLVVEALTTNETSWFRDNAPYDALKDYVTQLTKERTTDRTFRVWAAACSSGQEPYSIAMAISDQLAAAGWSLQIDATDLSEEMLERTRKGVYSQLEVNRGLPVTHLVRWFERVGTTWRIKEELRKHVKVSKANLATAFPVIGPYDVVFMRNVLIYFDTDTKRDILRRVSRKLRPQGLLFLGAAETTLGVDESWERYAIGRGVVFRSRQSAPGGK
jgi:chemotaxis protein methyltransferase CheR